ncbi:nuclease-related domain-containing protein [Lacisediminihabitans sp.]|jgi:hypothetical protein|uniref:nuclease-related domain-containing protein n=1 Tax=Lacisediminihabitans sp. TaxID=2787631 RepID=UPI002F931DCC
MSDLRGRVPAQALMERTLQLHSAGPETPSGESRPWYVGALGEIAVAGLLSSLGPEWTVLHSVPIGNGETDIDHVVIGPPGVFTINTKNHSGQDVWIGGHGLFVSGKSTRYIPAAMDEAAVAERRLSAAADLTVPVAPLIVLLNPGVRTVKAEPEGGVRVVSDAELLDLLRDRPVFSDQQVARIVEAAIKPETWHDNPRPGSDGASLAIRFNAIMARDAQSALAAAAVANSNPAVRATAPARAPWRAQLRSAPPPRRSGSGSRRRAKKSSAGEALAKLIVLGVALLIFYVGVLPAMQAAGHP